MLDDQVPAAFFERAAALAIECTLWLALSGGLFQAWGTVVAPFGGSVSMPWWPWSLLAEAALIVAALAWSYRWRRSPGMVAMGFALIDTRTNGRPSLFQSGSRAMLAVFAGVVGLAFGFAWLIAGAPHGSGLSTSPYFLFPNMAFTVLLLSCLPMRFTRRRQSLFDVITRTAVVKRPNIPATATVGRPPVQPPPPTAGA